MQVVLVLAELYAFAISESGKISFRRGLKWSAKARGTLCFTIVVVILTSACLTLLSKVLKEKASDLLVGPEIFSFLCVTVRANVPLYVFPPLVATTAFDPAKVAPNSGWLSLL